MTDPSIVPFPRYLRIIQELHRVELEDMQREEKLAFFVNLYNMMAIHAILVWGHPAGPLERTKMFGDFKYVIGGYTYSLSAIQNGILRGNQRPPYNLMKPFGAKDKRSKVTKRKQFEEAGLTVDTTSLLLIHMLLSSGCSALCRASGSFWSGLWYSVWTTSPMLFAWRD